MKVNESIILLGFRKYCCNSGYGGSVAYTGLESHSYDYAGKQAKEYITAIDAMPFGADKSVQYAKHFIDRELLKAHCGFNVP